MTNIQGKIESILFAAGKPLSLKKLAELLQVDKKEITAVLESLTERFTGDSGLRIIQHGEEVELATAPEYTDLVRQFLKKEELGELTRPQLEAASVIAYRGPITKAELEQIRGVNCSLILRNLQIRGLVEELSDGALPHYQITFGFLKFLGLKQIDDLPDYQRLHNPESLEQILNQSLINKTE